MQLTIRTIPMRVLWELYNVSMLEHKALDWDQSITTHTDFMEI